MRNCNFSFPIHFVLWNPPQHEYGKTKIHLMMYMCNKDYNYRIAGSHIIYYDNIAIANCDNIIIKNPQFAPFCTICTIKCMQHR